MGFYSLTDEGANEAVISLSSTPRRKGDVLGATRAQMYGKGEKKKEKESQALKRKSVHRELFILN